METENGWFAARPSGTENIYKIYAESFKGIEHLRQLQEEAQKVVNDAIGYGRIKDRYLRSSHTLEQFNIVYT